MTAQFFIRDQVHGAITSPDGESVTEDGFDWDEQTTVTIDNEPWSAAFDTDQFVKLDVTVARPIEQTYVADERIAAKLDVDVGDLVTLKKHPEALQSASWMLDNTPTPIGHPDSGLVQNPEDVHGFLKEPEYVTRDDDPDESTAHAYVPVTDDEARAFISEHGDVSVGFWNDLNVDTDEEGIDAYQRSIVYDHVAHVRHGRCAGEDGCGIISDSIIQSDAVGTTHVEEGTREDVTVGDWVKWDEDMEIVHGRVIGTGSATSSGSSSSASEPRSGSADGDTVQVERYDGPTSTGNTVSLDASDLDEWVGPLTDTCPGDTCSCGCHVSSETAADGLTTDKSVNGITFQGTRSGDLDEPAIPNDDYEDNYVFAAETKSESSFPLVDADGHLRRENVIAAASFSDDAPDEGELLSVLRQVNDEFDDPPLTEETLSTDTTTTMSNGDDPDNDSTPFDLDDLSVDAVRERHDGVEEQIDEYETSIDEYESTVDEKDEKIEELEDRIEAVKDSQLEADDVRKRDELVDEIISFTDRWDEEEMRSPKEGPDLDTLEERRDLVNDLGSSEADFDGDGPPDNDSSDEDQNDGPVDLRTARTGGEA